MIFFRSKRRKTNIFVPQPMKEQRKTNYSFLYYQRTKINQSICSSTNEGMKTNQSTCSSTIKETKTKRSICSSTNEGTKTKRSIRSSLNYLRNEDEAKYSFLNCRWFDIANCNANNRQKYLKQNCLFILCFDTLGNLLFYHIFNLSCKHSIYCCQLCCHSWMIVMLMLIPAAICRWHCWYLRQIIAGVVNTRGNLSPALLTQASNYRRRSLTMVASLTVRNWWQNYNKKKWHSHVSMCYDDSTLIK